MFRSMTPTTALLALTMVAACSRQPADNAADVAAGAAASNAMASPAPNSSLTPRPAQPGSGSDAIALDPLSARDLEGAALTGELGCSFVVGRDPLLVAMGNVASADRSQGVIKAGGRVERIGMPGGFDAMDDGGSFTGQGSEVRIRVTGPAIARGESPARPATLTYERSGVSRTIVGQWHCGP